MTEDIAIRIDGGDDGDRERPQGEEGVWISVQYGEENRMQEVQGGGWANPLQDQSASVQPGPNLFLQIRLTSLACCPLCTKNSNSCFFSSPSPGSIQAFQPLISRSWNVLPTTKLSIRKPSSPSKYP